VSADRGPSRTLGLWDLLVPGLLLVVAAVFLTGAFAIVDYGTDVVPPQAFPLAMSILLGLSAFAYLGTVLQRRRKPAFAITEGERQAAQTGLILAGVGVAMPWIGFYPAVGVGLFAMLTLARAARVHWIVAIVGGILGFIFVVFDWLLSVPLPMGPV
jgi:hypothetical protein